MISPPYQAVAFDLDDTLLRDDRTISGYTLSVLHALDRKGVRLLPVSGRTRLSMKPYVDQIGNIPLYISCNGAEIWKTESDVPLHAERFTVALGKEIAAFGKRHGCYAHTYGDSCFYFNFHCVWAERYAESSSLTGVCVGDLEEYIREPRNKILMVDEAEKITAMLAEAEDQFRGRASVTSSKPLYLEFNPAGATKGNALRLAAGMLGLRMEDIVAFGDSLNDLSMLQSAGLGVIMANGREELRPLCGGVCGTNQEDGVARCLETLFREVLA